MGVRDGIATMIRALLFCLAPWFAFHAHGDTVSDPFEKFNRQSHHLNQTFDEHLVRPVAGSYRRLLPVPVKRSLDRFYGNLEDAGDAVNSLLQGKADAFVTGVLRVGINSTLGLGGFLDPASRLGLENHDEDFAQTLAKWGVPRGPYLVIPFLGPSSLRDVFARAINTRVDPVRYLRPVDQRNVVYATRFIHVRANLLVAEEAVFGDRYLFFRDAYLQRRRYLELDGEVAEDLFSDEFDDL